MKIKDRQKAAKEVFKLPPGKLQQVDLNESRFVPMGMTRAFRNNRYTVMIYDNAETSHGPAINVLIQRHDALPIPGHWKEIYNIKNEVFGSETWAVEYYPPESELIDNKNIYWIWIYPKGVLPEPTIGKL